MRCPSRSARKPRAFTVSPRAHSASLEQLTFLGLREVEGVSSDLRQRLLRELELRLNLVDGASTERIRTETGSMVVSTPETTAFDLVRFPAACGYWNNVATVLGELAERIDADKLHAGASRVARSDVQRLGWLLELVEERELADALANALEGLRLLPTPLTNARDSTDAPLDSRWRVLVNDDVEPDL